MSESTTEQSPKAEATTMDESMPESRPAMRRFPPDRLAFFQRIAEANTRDRQAAAIAQAHLVALENRIAQAARALAVGHAGSARAFLEIGRRDYDAALQALPEL